MEKKIISKKLFLVLLASLFVSAVFSQAVSVNADDSFYEDVLIWEQQGLVERLPNLRPYPLHLVRSILETVSSSGNERAARTASEHYERIFGKSIPINIFATGGGTVKLSSADDVDINVDIDIGAAGSIQITDLFSYCYDAEITVRNNDFILPYASNLPYDAIYDPATVGPLKAYTDVNMGFGFGKDDIYLTGGLFRSGYGPFLNSGFALNDSAYHQANLAFAFMRPKWNYVHQISVIGATDMTGTIKSLTYGKFMAFHALEINLIKNFSLSYYETIVWGKRFDFTYVLPIMYMIGQNINGASDNLQMGLLFEYTPFTWMKWATDFFIDDFSVNDILKFNLDAKYRFGFRTGLFFTPSDYFLDKATIDYTVQTPYLYAHWDYEGNENNKYYTANSVNYQNVTNAGLPIGSALPPNSDRIYLSGNLKPISGLKLSFDFGFIRHANVCEGYTDEEAWAYMTGKGAYYNKDGKYVYGLPTDGSAFSSQMYGGTNKEVKAAWDKLSLLSQEDKMYVFQAGLTAEYKLPLPIKLDVSLNAGYVFEYIKNVGVDRDIWKYDIVLAEWNSDYAEKFGKLTEAEKVAAEAEMTAKMASEAQKARNAWKAALYDVINNYFSFSVKVMW